MARKFQFAWQTIHQDGNSVTLMANMPHGVLVRVIDTVDGPEGRMFAAASMVFVPGFSLDTGEGAPPSIVIPRGPVGVPPTPS